MAKEIGNGLMLAMYLNIPNTKIVNACNDISETGLRDAEAADYVKVTDNLLRYWKLKRATVRDRRKVDELESALRAVGKNELADVLADRHQMNMEITADAFPQN